MRITFLTTDFLAQGMAIPILIKALKAHGHEPSLVGIDKSGQYLQTVLSLKPDAVAASLCYGEHHVFYQAIKDVKDRLPVLSIVGGPHPTFSPAEVIQENVIDYICIGEGERPLVAWADRFDQHQNLDDIPNIWTKGDNGIKRNDLLPLIQDLDHYPPDRTLYHAFDDFRESKTRCFMSGKGCPFHCSYCFNDQFNTIYKGKGPVVRKRSVDSLIEEIRSVRDAYGCEFIRFTDDIFSINKSWLREFARKYPKEINIPFQVNIRPNLVTEEQVRLLKESGCRRAIMAIECGNDHVRNDILNRGMSKQQILEACRLLNEQGIRIMTQNIVCIPDHGRHVQNDIETLELNIACKPLYAWASILHPYPGTPVKTMIDQQNVPMKESYTISTYHKETPFVLEDAYISLNLHHIFDAAVKLPRLKKQILWLCSIKSRGLTKLLYISGVFWKTYAFNDVFLSAEGKFSFWGFMKSVFRTISERISKPIAQSTAAKS